MRELLRSPMRAARHATRRAWRSASTSGSSPPSPAAARAGSRWDASATPELGRRLLSDGFCVVPDAFPPLYLRQLRDEMLALHARGLLYPNSTHILAAGAQQQQKTLLLEKRHILETELAVAPEPSSAATPFLRDLYDDCAVLGPLERALPPWLALTGHMCKLQLNEGDGACFPMHFDTYGHDGKCVTAVLYLNDGWQEGDGGEIVLYPFPKQREVLQPRFGELVLFSSQQMLHRVLPSSAPRLALTTWVYCDAAAASTPANAHARAAYYEPESLDGSSEFVRMMAKVLRSPFRRHLARLVHADEWRRSLLESHHHTQQFDEYMETQERELGVIQEATSRMLGNFRAGLAKKVGSEQAGSELPATVDELVERMGKNEEYKEFVARFQLAWF